ncbi:SNARE associated Golgi protein [Synechococcus sp. PCC 7335]|uniref:DedA family protein n=1 Tax=Synechococcus sp. (strain ATCC 29403 / PCC 7335) TaxID=91464 RepID=UPI00017ECE5D|nr:DedA family protein [Synechococcus sp. PCC 7335]EDX85463.1 SNARE associated Golgi protein [Synechococcus sp. PCC 7335]
MDVLEQVVDIITLFGYWGIAFLMLLENVIPPIPSELIMPLAGFAVARGDMNMPIAIFAGTVGSVLGGLAWYYVGKILGLARIRSLADRHGKWLGISSKEVVATQRWFSQRGYWAIGLGRLVPGIRTYISVPAGIAKMPMFQFLTYSTVGSLAWTTLLTLAGFWLGASYEKVGEFLGPISKLVLVSLAVIVVARVLSQLKKNL